METTLVQYAYDYLGFRIKQYFIPPKHENTQYGHSCSYGITCFFKLYKIVASRTTYNTNCYTKQSNQISVGCSRVISHHTDQSWS